MIFSYTPLVWSSDLIYQLFLAYVIPAVVENFQKKKRIGYPRLDSTKYI